MSNKIQKTEEDSRKKLAGKAVAAAAVTGVLVGGLFSSPADLTGDPNASAVDRTAPPPAIELVAEETEENSGGSEGAEELSAGGSSGEEKENTSGSGGSGGSGAGEGPEAVYARSGSLREAIRKAILKLPAGVRALVGVPLWCVGWVLLSSASALWSAVLSPVLGAFAGWILAAGLILLTAVITVKALFPDLPLKKILNRRALLGTLLGVAVLALADAVLPFFWENYEKFALLVKILGSSAVLAAVLLPFFRKKRKKA